MNFDLKVGQLVRDPDGLVWIVGATQFGGRDSIAFLTRTRIVPLRWLSDGWTVVPYESIDQPRSADVPAGTTELRQAALELSASLEHAIATSNFIAQMKGEVQPVPDDHPVRAANARLDAALLASQPAGRA